MRELNSPSERIQKQLFIKDLKAKDIVRTSLLVKHKELAAAKNGKAYLSMVLGDCTGSIDTRVWEDAEVLSGLFHEGDVIAIAGKTHIFKDRLQLVVEHLSPLRPGEVSLKDYLPAGPENTEELYSQMLAVFEAMNDPWVKQLGLHLLRDPDIAARYKVCPAAKTIHHAYLGGLLEHSLQLIKIVDAIMPLYKDIDRDVLVFGAAFHDFGKIYELSYDGNFGYTDEGRLVGHIAIACTLIDRKIQLIPGFPKPLEWHLKHLVLSHHGKLEFGSPKRPHTIEAQILHHLDDMDSKINSIQAFLRASDPNSKWTAHHKPYDQYYYRTDPTCALPKDHS